MSMSTSMSISTIGSMMTAVAVLLTQTVMAADAGMPAMGKKGATISGADQKLIQSAMRAAPKKVGSAATIVAMGADGQMRTLREGTNGFTCMPDNPATPGPG